jgi:4-amino-4-deoxy-L-arabinose transferase-like glycosyltransferase
MQNIKKSLGLCNKPMRQHRAMIGITLLGTLLRLLLLDRQNIAFDESFSLVVGLADWPTLFQAILSDGVHPPFFYVLHKGALTLWGVSEFGQRFSAAVFSLISIPLCYRGGRIIFNQRVGLLAAFWPSIHFMYGWLKRQECMACLVR